MSEVNSDSEKDIYDDNDLNITNNDHDRHTMMSIPSP
jgi:hypothetical protein